MPDDVAAIDELEEIELVPRIQIVQQGEQVLLKGHLLLTGVYRAQNDPSAEQPLEHWIPVEITLPMNRINRLDDIAVEIDNFDVELLSSRTLNITGVLSLLGIELEKHQEQESWRREEPFTVIHTREAEAQRLDSESFHAAEGAAQSFSPEEAQRAAEEELQREAWLREEEARASVLRSGEEPQAQESVPSGEQAWDLFRREEHVRDGDPRRDEQVWNAGRLDGEAHAAEARQAEAREAFARDELEREVARQEAEQRKAFYRESGIESGYGGANPSPAVHAEPLHEQQPERPAAPAHIEESGIQPFHNEAQQESFSSSTFNSPQSFGDVSSPAEPDALKKEMRVAVMGKSAAEDPAPAANGLGFRSLLQSSKREQEARAVAEQSAQRAADEANKPAGDDMEWKNIFFGQSIDESFRKLRMCIVQREETLELIADRYHLQPREIALYNRLSDQNISEGQVLYIP
nr:LysM peptidoglycan-binding domain-containing protein [Paenibacillus oenotherae]